MESLDWITRLSPWAWVIFSIGSSIAALLWAVSEER